MPRSGNSVLHGVNPNLKKTKPFVPNAPFLYPLKTSENFKIFWCFQGVEKGFIGSRWVTSIDVKQRDSSSKQNKQN